MTKVTLAFDRQDVRPGDRADEGFRLTYARQRVEAGPALAVLTCQTG